MQPGPRPKPTLLRLIAGDQHRERLRADAPPDPQRRPELPPIVELSPAELRAWRWLLRNVYDPRLHDVADSALFVSAARLLVRCATADHELNESGLVMRNPRTNQPMPNPYVRISTIAHNQLRLLLAELGSSPSARYRCAPPRGVGRASDWDDIV
jgi:phage terminase small subunit